MRASTRQWEDYNREKDLALGRHPRCTSDRVRVVMELRAGKANAGELQRCRRALPFARPVLVPSHAS